MAANVFDTYKSSDKIDSFIDEFNFKRGSIIIGACKDECNRMLSIKAKHFLANMGSIEIWNLWYRQGFVIIATYA